MMSKDEKKGYEQPELDGYTVDEVVQAFRYAKAYKSKFDNADKLIRKIHSGDFWEDIKKKLPEHQITPDTNYLEYIEKNIVNSIYTGNYIANVLPRHFNDNEYALQLNSFLQYRWNKLGMKPIFPKLGKNAVLTNYSGLQIGWNSDVIGGSSHSKEQGSVEVKFLPPGQLVFDPSITNYMDGRYLFIAKKVSLFDLINEPDLREGAEAYKAQLSEKGKFEPNPVNPEDYGDTQGKTDTNTMHSRTVGLLECFWKQENESGGYRIDHLFIVDEQFVIKVKKGIKPNKFPITVLYGEEPDSDPYGVPLAKKVIANIVALNILDSIEATHVYLTQNRTKLVNVRSGINYRTFAKYGHMPHLAFHVNGDPNKVVRYVDVQQMPKIDMLKNRLEQGIFLVTGVDLRYTGRDTGSVQTTGGMDLQQQRIMSMSDNLRINSLECFVEATTELIIDMYVQFGSKYHVPKVAKEGGKVLEELKSVDFKKIEQNAFDYTMSAGPYLPKNTMRLSDAADQLMELQGQYQFQPPLITNEEWIQWKEFPQKDLIIQRMRQAQRQIEEEELIADLMSFAGLIDKGMSPEEAIETIIEEKQFKKDNPNMAAPGSTVANGQGPIMG
jgi:hypothetical protein